MRNPNDPQLKSWVEVPQDSDFPIQNLPFGIFNKNDQPRRAGIAIGSRVIDLAELTRNGFLDGLNLNPELFEQPTLNEFISLGRSECGKVRSRVSELLDINNEELKASSKVEEIVIDASLVTMHLPVNVKNYTDFYSSKEHATNIGTMFRDPDNALLPNWKHLPVAYHGRASSIVVSGTDIRRPCGQTKGPEDEKPKFGPSQRLDFELEMAFVTCKANAMGDSISTEAAEEHIFGFCLFNDWSARDIQTWEYVPLGPFLAKNFASSVSPWIVTLDALEPFRVNGPEQEEKVLPYLEFQGKKNFDIDLEVLIKPESAEATKVCHSNFKYMYWNINQQLAHHTVNGCNVQVGDMYASGTISGPSPESYGSMLEIAWRGTKPVKMKDNTERKFIHDGDEVIMKGFCEKDGVRIGFGEVRNKVLPAKQ